MKIVSKNDFHTLTTALQVILQELYQKSIKFSRSQEILADALSFKSSNGLIHSVPFSCKLDVDVVTKICDKLKTKHQFHEIKVDDVLGQLELSLRRPKFSHKKIPNSDYKIFYDLLVESDEKPLSAKGHGYLREEIPILSIHKSSKTITPSIVKDIFELQDSHVGNRTGLKFLLPSEISFFDLHQFLTSKEFVAELNKLDKNFSNGDHIPTMRQYKLNAEGVKAKMNIEKLLIDRFGTSSSDLFQEYYSPVLKSIMQG